MNVTAPQPGRPPGAGPAALRPVVLWAVVLAALTGGAAAWLGSTGGDYRDFSPAILVVAYAPSVAAVAVACSQRGAYGARALLAQLLRWRTGPGWYALALVGPIALALVTVGSFTVLGRTPSAAPLVLPAGATVTTLLGPVLAGALGEELGWRGFAQARLQTRWGALVAAVVVGIGWSTWHLWPGLTPAGAAELSPVNLAQTFLRLVATAILYAWLYNASRRSLPVVLVAHAGHDIAVDLMPGGVIGTNAGALTMAGLYVLAAAAVLVGTRGRLGCVRGHATAPVVAET